jgi:serine/threonine-protein kinase
MSFWSRIRIVQRLDPAEAAAFDVEVADINRRRLRVLAPIMVCLHVLHIALFYPPPSLRFSLEPDQLRWRMYLVYAHAAMIPIALALAWAVYRARRAGTLALVGPVVAIAYMIHGGIVTGIDQILLSNITTYMGFCFGIAMVFVCRPRVSLVAYAAGAAALATGMLLLQRSAGAKFQNFPAAATMTVVSMVFSWLQYGARQREFLQRRTIDRQKEELAGLNANLERRVEDQVSEIVARAAEVEQLNKQLQAQVRARSGELSLALARLAQQEDGTIQTGTVLGGRFLIDQAIGEGGMGTVYTGTDTSSGARVAIKVIQAASSGQLEAMRRFIREAGAAATVIHPAVVRMIHIDVSPDGLLFQVQELIEGKTMAARLRKWPAADAARVVSVLCDALAAAHAQGVVHRDVKPDNIMLSPSSPGLKLLDFGIAKLYDAFSAGQNDTRTGIVVGTPTYMAPEQVAGGEVTDRADVYAVGVLLFQLLEGKLPYDAHTPREMMVRHLNAKPAAMTHAPEALARLVARCLEKDPPARPNASQVAQTLREFADAEAARWPEVIAREVISESAEMTAAAAGPRSLTTLAEPLARERGK